MDIDSIHHRAGHLRDMLHERIGVGGRDLETALRRAGRLLPRHVRREAALVAEAERLAGNPRLARRIDLRRLERAYRESMAFLESQNPATRRIGLALSALGGAALGLIAAAGLVVTVLVWRGYL